MAKAKKNPNSVWKNEGESLPPTSAALTPYVKLPRNPRNIALNAVSSLLDPSTPENECLASLAQPDALNRTLESIGLDVLDLRDLPEELHDRKLKMECRGRMHKEILRWTLFEYLESIRRMNKVEFDDIDPC